ncbi:expressed unknown protein [Seminavis robusta]|uniref:Uncharacterized protein n=1 Tax=Seminavis robusta TaxID=568900 RepID=A0A9N8H9R9_9STRA|nr:expressed unknown protein [Seminavis robusta]|eukprot:Sro201_g085000.1 n/a (243) ;mRNA; r:27405-28362
MTCGRFLPCRRCYQRTTHQPSIRRLSQRDRFTGSGNLAVSRSNTNSSNGRWVEIDSKNTSVRLDRRTFMSIPQSNLENRTLYRFRITDLTYDLGGDGMCCVFGYGWVTLTNGTRTESSPDGTVIWSLLGNEFTTEAEVYIWINGNGQTEVVAIDKDGGLRPDIPGNPVPGLSPDPGDGSDNADFLLPILENGNDAGNADNSPPTNSEPGNGGFLEIPVVGGGDDNAKGQSDRDPLIVQGEFP